MNVGETIDSLINKARNITPNIKWAALGFVAGLLTSWIV